MEKDNAADPQRAFHGILTRRADTRVETHSQPAFFVDLNLDQIIDSVTGEKQEYDLKPFFYTPLTDADSIEYRHEIFRDLENLEFLDNLEKFAQSMRTMRGYLTQSNKLHCLHQKEQCFLEAVTLYCNAVNDLAHDINLARPHSRGFCAFREFVDAYVHSNRFTALAKDNKETSAGLSGIRYSMIIHGGTIKVRQYASEPDYSADVELTFEKFKQGAAKDYRARTYEPAEMNSVEEKVLEFVAALNPEAFARLDNFYLKNRDYLDKAISAFDREIHFYIAYVDYMEKLSNAGLHFCYPQISNPGKDIFDYDGFDLALAEKLVNNKSMVVCNDFYLQGKERIIIVSGPNQGGKTTFARTFGQLHFLASIGCPVPGREARLFLFDHLFTHFEKQEDIKSLSGKLQEELVRVTEILEKATPDSVVILNEIFNSTTLIDAIFLSKELMGKIDSLDSLCICVTFIDELSVYSEKTVSMVSTVVPEKPVMRTFKIVRKPADGLSYALSISEKYRLTYKSLKERLDHESVTHVSRS